MLWGYYIASTIRLLVIKCIGPFREEPEQAHSVECALSKENTPGSHLTLFVHLRHGAGTLPRGARAIGNA